MKNKRKIYPILILSISLLCTHQFIDVYAKFQFLIINLLENLHKSVVIYMFLVLLISLTGYLSVIYNWRLLKRHRSFIQTDLIDSFEVKDLKPHGWMYIAYIMFSVLLIGLGIFLAFTSFKEASNLSSTIIVCGISIIIIGLGVLFLKDGIQIKKMRT